MITGPGLRTTNGTTASTIVYNASGPISTTNVGAVNLTSTGGALTFGPATNAAPVNIRTTGGVGANGVTLNSTGQAATVTMGNISTTGASSFGVLSNGGADLTLRTGDVTTTGVTSRGIQVTQTGSVNIVAGNVTTTDRAIQVSPGATSDATVVAGNITSSTSGALVNGNNVRITTGNVSVANGFGIVGQSLAGTTGSVFVRTGDVNSTGGSGVGGTAFNATGGVDIGCGTVTSNSPGGAAVFAQNTGTGALTINCGAVTNVGNNAVFVRSFGAPQGGNISITTTSAASSNTNFSTVFALTSGAGTITVNTGTVTGGASGAGLGATGIDLNAGTGAIDAGYGNVTTVGTALRSTSTGTLNLRGALATLRTSGAGATGALINASGVTGNLGNVITTGVGSQGAVITSTAPVNLTIGNVATTGNGVTINAGANAVTLATGAVTATESGASGTVINSTGAVNFTGGRQVASGANALQINGGAGAINAAVAGASTTGTGTAVAITGTGPLIFANTGAITTTGAASNGINISGVTTAGVTCGNVSTIGPNSPAVIVASNGNTSVTCGAVTTIGAASDAIRVTNTAGTTTVTGGTTSATGAGSRGIVVSSSAPSASNLVTVNTGVLTANGNGVVADATSGASVLVNANGDVTSTTGSAITATTTGGAATVNQALGTTITAATDSIRVINTIGGAINVNAVGTLIANNGSGVFVSTSAASADPINVTTNVVRSTGGPGTWGSQVRASAGTGDITITSNGPMSSAGAPGSIFGGILALTNGTSDRNVTVNVNANIGSLTDRSSASQVLVSGTSSTARTLAVNISNASIFGGPGAVQVQQNGTSLGQIRIIGTGAGTLSANGATGIGVNARILNASNPGDILVDLAQNVDGTAQGINATTLGTGTVTVIARGNVTSSNGAGITVASGGRAVVTVGAGTTTSGTGNAINSTAAGGSTITNAGVIISTGGFAIDANGGSASITNTGIVNGRIDLTGNADTFANNAGGLFNAVGASDFGLGNDSFINAGVLTAFSSATFNGLENFNNTGLIDLRDGVADDILTLTGTTFTGGPGSQLGLDVSFATNSADRLVIGTAAGTTTLLLNRTAPGTVPLLNLNGILLVDADSAAASNFQLGGVTDFGFTRLNLVFDAATSNFRVITAPDREVFETGRYGVGMTNAWNQSGDAWSARMTELRDVAFTKREERPDGFEMWAQGYAGSEGQNQVRSFNLGGTAKTFDLSYDQEFQGFQLGGDVQRSMGWGTMVFGLTGGVINSDQEFASGNSFALQGGNLGAYAGLYAGGFFLNGLVKADRYEATVMSSTAFFRDEIQATTVGAKAEVGYRMGVGGFFVEPVIALAYTDSDLDDLSVPGGVFKFEDNESLRGEAGVRVGGDFAMGSSRIQPFIGVFAVDELRGQNTAVFTSGSTSFGLQDVEPETYGKVSVGLNLLEQDGVNLFVRGDALFSGEAKGGSVRIGARWSF